MGNTSSNLPQNDQNEFVWNPKKERELYNIPEISCFNLLSERIISLFQEVDPINFSNITKHNPSDLAGLVLGFYEQLGNVEKILEYIIESEIGIESDMMQYLVYSFTSYLKIANNRNHLYQFNSYFKNTFYSPFPFKTLHPIDGFDELPFSMLMIALTTSFLLLNEPQLPFKVIVPIVSYFYDSVSTPSLHPPSSDFLTPQQTMHDEVFTSSYVNTHGICSNGDFLFILCSDATLQIFPLINGGTLSSMITVGLDFPENQIPARACIVATKNKLNLMFSERIMNYNFEYDIFQLIQSEKIQSNSNNDSHCFENTCSDGITEVAILPDLSMKVYSVKNKVLLYQGALSKAGNLPNDLSSIIFETNGVFLGAIVQKDNETALYKVFSLNTGEFLHEEKFSTPDKIVASTIDSIHKCRWAVIFAGNSRFLIRRYAFQGGLNTRIFDIHPYNYPMSDNLSPFSYFPLIISALHRHMSGLINSHISPSVFLCQKVDELYSLIELLEKILNLSENNIRMTPEALLASKECLTILISLNLKRISCTSKPSVFIVNKILKIVALLPSNLAGLLFFSNFDYLTFDCSDESISLLQAILNASTNEYLISFAFRMMEMSSSLSKFPFKMSNGLFDLIPQDLREASELKPQIFAFLTLHQRCLVLSVADFIKNDPFAVIQLSRRTPESTTPLDILNDYIQFIVSKLDAALVNNFDQFDLKNSIIFSLFSNFMRLLSVLVNSHSIAQVTTALLSLLINKLSNVSKENEKAVLYTIFIFGKFASTLLIGGGMSEFESKFLWLIKSNINLISEPELMKGLSSDITNNFDDERINLFLNDQGDSINLLYKKCKPHFNRNLTGEVKNLDRIALTAFAKHIGCLDEMLFYDGSRPPSTLLKSAFDQMLRVRNEYRSYHQTNKDVSNLRKKCLMLLRMKGDSNVLPKNLGDFVVSNFDPDIVTKILKVQNTRFDTTLVGFALIDRIYSMNVNSLFHQILAYNLSKIETFEGLSSIMRIKSLSEQQEKQVFSFFRIVIDNVSLRKSYHLIAVSFRFFRDLDSLPGIQSYFLEEILKLYQKMPSNCSLFALALLLTKNIQYIPQELLKLDLNSSNPFRWLILSESIKESSQYSQPDEVFINDFLETILWNSNPENMRPILRVFYNIQSYLYNPEPILLAMLNFIGEQIKLFRNLTFPIELIYLLRKIILDENAPLNSNLINIFIESNFENANELIICGIFAVLGNSIENIRPYSLIRYHSNRLNYNEYYVVPRNSFKHLVFFPSPFNIDSDLVSFIPSSIDVYPVPLYEIPTSKFPYFDFILSFFVPISDLIYTTPTTLAIYMQVFSNYCNTTEFLQLLFDNSTREMKDYLQLVWTRLLENPCSLHDINETIKALDIVTNKRIIPEYNGFNVVSHEEMQYKTLLSPPIIENAPSFQISIEIPKTKDKSNFYFGIVSDNLEPTYTRFILIEYPSGTVYPILDPDHPYHIKFFSSQIIMRINPYEKSFSLCSNNYSKVTSENTFMFPYGSKFRTLVATNLSDINQLKIQTIANNNIPIYDLNSTPVIQYHDNMDDAALYNFPGWVGKYSKNLPPLFSTIPAITNIVNPYSLSVKVKNSFSIPPSNIIIHGMISNQASPELLQSLYRGYFKKLSLQYSTMAITRIINNNHPEVASTITFKLFRHYINALEPLSVSLFEQGLFPFTIDSPIWNNETAHIYMLFDNEIKKALTTLISLEQNVNNLALEIWSFANSKKLHSLILPQVSQEFYNQTPKRYIIPRNVNKFFVFSDFDIATGLWSNVALIKKSPISFPLLFSQKNENIEINFDVPDKTPCFRQNSQQNIPQLVFNSPLNRSLCCYTLNPMNNNWLINTPLELLLLLKNFIYVARHEHRQLVKSIILDSFFCQSPMMSCYISIFADLVQVQMPLTPLDRDEKYLSRLTLLGGFLNTVPEPNFLNIYQREQTILSNKSASELAVHFPEFFSAQLPPPRTNKCKIPAVIIDPGALNNDFDFTSHILTLRLFSKRYDSLYGFPFWELMPYWVRLSGFSEHTDKDFIRPSVDKISSEVLRVTNPSLEQIFVQFQFNKSLPRDSLLMLSETSLFEDATYVNYPDLSKPISVKKGETYFSIITQFPNPWKDCFYKLILPKNIDTKSNRSVGTMTIDINIIHDRFISDMKEFAIQWTENDTNDLLALLPHSSLSNSQFDEVESIARGSSLASKFNPNVVALKALILHHFNYIRINRHNYVPENIWANFTSFLSLEDASESLLSHLKCDPYVKNGGIYFTINRHKARQLILDGKGSYTDSVIFQLSKIIHKYGGAKFRIKEKPWSVNFTGELAIDAGGPARELIVEASSSIFEPTTALMIQVDPDIGSHQHYYVPNENATGRMLEFYAIGVLLGIIIRTGLVQDLPFAQFIWKAITGEQITEIDILESDGILRDAFKRYSEEITENKPSNQRWTVETWDGRSVLLPGKNPNLNVMFEDLNSYKREIISYRINSIMPMLRMIRKGFVDNVGFERHPILTGNLLSRLAQGSGTITIEQLMAITRVFHFDNGMRNIYITRFWKAVSRFNDEQRMLLFKFITTLTRLPTSSGSDKEFVIKIDPLKSENPDQMLPTASTCFNRLHLPLYSNEEIAYEKILYAVQFCQTMENK